jgi:hypothetical protein
MPDGYLGKERLAGRARLFDWPVLEGTENTGQPAEPADQPPAPPDKDPKTEEETPASFDEILRILHREESPGERARAERAGRLSERLLLRNSLDEVRSLLARGANPSIADENGQTPLMLAAAPPLDQDRFRLLVQAGADVHARRYDGYTGLHLACAGGMHEAAEEWVRAGADVHARGPEGATPLMLCASWLAVVRVLVPAGADVNAADRDGHTALAYAVLKQSWVAAENHLEALRTLLAAGAGVNHRDNEGITPLGHAQRMLDRVKLEEEVCRAFHPWYDQVPRMDWDDRRMAEAVYSLVASAGGQE